MKSYRTLHVDVTEPLNRGSHDVTRFLMRVQLYCYYQKSSKSSILKPASTGTRLSTQNTSAAGSVVNSQRIAAKPDGTTTNKAPSSRTTGKDQNKQKSSNDWDDSSWGDQW